MESVESVESWSAISTIFNKPEQTMEGMLRKIRQILVGDHLISC